jgi:hypothetical protein
LDDVAEREKQRGARRQERGEETGERGKCIADICVSLPTPSQSSTWNVIARVVVSGCSPPCEYVTFRSASRRAYVVGADFQGLATS